MQIIRKDAAVTSTGADDDFPGTFEAVLSAPTEDRDGETLLASEWKTPLPDRITVDVDHGMTVASTIGSAKPWIDDAGRLCISGTFASTPKAQEVRTLMNEGHINTTSVAYMTDRAPQKDGKATVTRELLNAAVVAIPSNREALVLSSKSGARNSAKDAVHVQAIHDHAIALGAMSDMKSASRKAAGPDGMCEECGAACCAECGACSSCAASDSCCAMHSAAMKACCDAMNEALTLIADVDLTTLPDEVQQALLLIRAACASCEEPEDESADPAAKRAAAAAVKAAAAASKAAGDAESDAITALSVDLLAAEFVTD